MHFETSISLATGVSCRAGVGTDEAERRTKSASSDIVGRGIGVGSSNSNNAMASSLTPPAGRNGLDVDKERLELRGLGIGVADNGVSELGAKTLAGARP